MINQLLDGTFINALSNAIWTCLCTNHQPANRKRLVLNGLRTFNQFHWAHQDRKLTLWLLIVAFPCVLKSLSWVKFHFFPAKFTKPNCVYKSLGSCHISIENHRQTIILNGKTCYFYGHGFTRKLSQSLPEGKSPHCNRLYVPILRIENRLLMVNLHGPH